MGQISLPDDFVESKTLIDASDKPLRRRSPPGVAVHEEDWPVLYPNRPTSPGTLQEMMRETGSQLTQQVVSGQEERYPLLGNTLRHVPDEEQLPISRYSAMYKIPRKEVSSPNLGKTSSKTGAGNTNIDDPFKDGVYDSGPGKLFRNRSFGSVLETGYADSDIMTSGVSKIFTNNIQLSPHSLRWSSSS